MTKFEQMGVNAQMDATTPEEARRSFQWSCNCCCNHGMRLDCDRCAIRACHYSTLAIFNDNVKMKNAIPSKEFGSKKA